MLTAAVIINDSVFAAVLGVSFTSSIALMAWIVKTLAGLVARVESVEDRVDRLETAWWAKQFGGARLTSVLAGMFVLVFAFWGGLWLWTESNAQRRQDACEFRQGIWDGQVDYTRYLADEFQVTEKQEAEAIVRLRKRIGPRPPC